jgi:4a-hydroxytetrahydrobiopterin dehydratase
MQRKETPQALEKIFQFESFIQAIERMHLCSADIDQLDHHPERTNIYDRVEVKLTTHDAGNIVTAKDHQLAHILDDHYLQYNS